MNNRRKLLVALAAGAVTAPLGSFAQQRGKLARIGFLGTSTAADTESRVKALQAGLRDLGYNEGKNIVTEFRWAAGNYARLPDLADELVRLKVEVIVTHGTPGIQAAQRTTATIPIVMATSGDVVGLGIVDSLARPGGNITGSTILGREINMKRIELLKEVLPSMRRVAVLSNKNNPQDPSRNDAIQIAARALKIEAQYFYATGPNELEDVFSEMARRRVDTVMIPNDAIFIANARAIGAIVSKRRIASISFTEIADAGGLMAYGASIPEMFRRAAYFVDRILTGAKPGDLPVEQPTKFELVVNMKAAKALGIKIPNTILVRADRVIE